MTDEDTFHPHAEEPAAPAGTAENRYLAEIAEAGGMAYGTADGRVFVGVPRAGEWIFGHGGDLEAVMDVIEYEDGKAFEGDGVVVVPYLEKDEVADEIRTWIESAFAEDGHFVKLVDADDLVVSGMRGRRVPG